MFGLQQSATTAGVQHSDFDFISVVLPSDFGEQGGVCGWDGLGEYGTRHAAKRQQAIFSWTRNLFGSRIQGNAPTLATAPQVLARWMCMLAVLAVLAVLAHADLR